MRTLIMTVKKDIQEGPVGAAMQQEDGFTLAELLVTVLIMVILMIGLAGMIESGAKSSATSYNLVRMEEAANEAINNMTRQIRVASSISPSSNNSLIIFSGDLNGDGSVTSQTFKAEDGFLYKDGQPWIEGVSSLTVTYYWYNMANREEEVLTPGMHPGWFDMIDRVAVTLDMSMDSMGVELNRSYHGSATIMNALR